MSGIQQGIYTRKFFDQQEYALAAFMLHQCMESAIKAIPISIMQHPLKTHSIHKLMCIVQHVTPAISAAFPRDTEAEITLFKLLDEAYAHSRLPSKFTISREACETLMTRLQRMVGLLPDAFDLMIKAIHGDAVKVEHSQNGSEEA